MSLNRSKVYKSLYDRQLDTDLFKRLHATNFTLAPKRKEKILGPGSYNPLTIEEIYRRKSTGKYGRYYQQSQRFSSKHLYRIQEMNIGLSNIPDQIKREREFQRRFNSIRLDRQSHNQCQEKRALVPRAPPVTLYEKSSFVDELQRKQTGIYGAFVRLAKDRSQIFPDWYKGPARIEDKPPKSMFDSLFSSSNHYKGKFLPLHSHRTIKSSPGPTTYFQNLITKSKHYTNNPSLGFLSSTDRFRKTHQGLLHLGPASYKPHICPRLCSKKKQINAHISIYLLCHIACRNSRQKRKNKRIQK